MPSMSDDRVVPSIRADSTSAVIPVYNRFEYLFGNHSRQTCKCNGFLSTQVQREPMEG
jgi:hypothetical protein